MTPNKSYVTYKFPHKFYRLNLYELNLTQRYNSRSVHSGISSNNPKGEVVTNYNLQNASMDLYAFEDLKSWACKPERYLTTQTFTCAQTCPTVSPIYMVGQTLSSTGYCNSICNQTDMTKCLISLDVVKSGTPKCEANTTILSLDQCYLSTDSNTYTQVDERVSFYYSPVYASNGSPISLTLSTTDDYFIDIWYLPDNRSNIKIDSSLKSYIFFSNIARIFHIGDPKRIYFENKFGYNNGDDISGYFNQYNWNKITFYVKKNSNLNFSIELYLNDNYRKVVSGSYQVPEASLSYIVFCHKDSLCQAGTINWTSGFYKGLKLWVSSFQNSYNLGDAFNLTLKAEYTKIFEN